MAAIAWILDALMHVFETLGAIFLVIMTLIITWQVISRSNVHINSPWTEEVALILMVWFGMAGAAIGVRKNTHIGVEFLVNLFPAGLRRFMAVFVALLVTVFGCFLAVEGWILARGCWNDQMSVTLMRRGLVVYMAVPVAAVLMVLYSLESTVKILADRGGDTRV